MKREPKRKQAPARSCQHLNFCFLGISTDWVPKKSAEKPVQLASTFSLFFSAALKLLLSSFKNRAKIQMFLTQTELILITWHVLKIGPLYFNWLISMFFRRSRIKSEKRILIVRIYFASRGTWGGAWICSPPRWTLSIRDALYQSVQLPQWAPVTALIPSQVSHVLTFMNPND